MTILHFGKDSDNICYSLWNMAKNVFFINVWKKKHKWLPWQKVWSEKSILSNGVRCMSFCFLIYNLDIRLSFCDALKYTSKLWLFHKIWKAYLKWNTSRFGVEGLKTCCKSIKEIDLGVIAWIKANVKLSIHHLSHIPVYSVKSFCRVDGKVVV